MPNQNFTVEDGTGVVQINYKLKEYKSLLKQRKKIDEKYKEQAKNLKKWCVHTNENWPEKFPDVRPTFAYADNVRLPDKAVSNDRC